MLKKLIPTLLVVLIFVLAGCTAVPPIPIGSYGQGTQEATAPATHILVQQATGGSFAAEGNDTYRLTLSGVAENAPLLQTGAEADAWSLTTGVLSTGWEAAPGLTATDAVLHIPEGTVVLDLSSPVYDPQTATLRYTATIKQLLDAMGESSAKTKDVAVPEDFAAATLFVQMDDLFLDRLEEGFASTGLRVCLRVIC